jgi:hypothetical protein
VEFGVGIEAAVADDDEAVVGIAGVEEGREDDAAGGDAEEDQGVDFLGAQDHLQIGALKGADAMLGNDDVVFVRTEGGVDVAAGAVEELLVALGGFDGAEERIARADLGQAGAEADADFDQSRWFRSSAPAFLSAASHPIMPTAGMSGTPASVGGSLDCAPD